MRELVWAANGKRRDEWSRFGQLLDLVHNRTIADSNKEKPTKPTDWWPDGLISKEEIEAAKRAERAARERSVVRVPFSVVMQMALGGK